jgi:hypothetical protein
MYRNTHPQSNIKSAISCDENAEGKQYCECGSKKTLIGVSSDGKVNKNMCKQNLATVASDILDFIAKERD